MLCFVDRGVLLGGGESVILWNKFFCCFANSQLLVVCMHVCEHTTSHHFNVKIACWQSGVNGIAKSSEGKLSAVGFEPVPRRPVASAGQRSTPLGHRAPLEGIPVTVDTDTF